MYYSRVKKKDSPRTFPIDSEEILRKYHKDLVLSLSLFTKQ